MRVGNLILIPSKKKTDFFIRIFPRNVDAPQVDYN
jgi:hypothetical protein